MQGSILIPNYSNELGAPKKLILEIRGQEIRPENPSASVIQSAHIALQKAETEIHQPKAPEIIQLREWLRIADPTVSSEQSKEAKFGQVKSLDDALKQPKESLNIAGDKKPIDAKGGSQSQVNQNPDGLSPANEGQNQTKTDGAGTLGEKK